MMRSSAMRALRSSRPLSTTTTTATTPAAAAAAASDLPRHAEVVVVGGGVIGCSVAYNLAKRGVKDVVLLERHALTSGTTWHAAGLVGQMRSTKIETALCAESVNVLGALEEETGLATGFKQCGSLTTARTRERFEVMKRNAARARSYDLEAECLTPEECGAMLTHDGVTLIRTDDLYGGLWLPGDGSGSPTDLTVAFAKGARMRGARLFEGVVVDSFELTSVDQGRKRVSGVALEDGTSITADKVVLCGGQWSRDLGRAAGVNVPLHSCEHFYATTNKMPGVHPGLPVFRDNDSFTYFREWGEGLLVGGFEPNAKPIWTEGPPKDFAFGLLEDDLDHFSESIWEPASERIPGLADAEINAFVNGPESFTPDNNYILGEAPEVENFFVAAGFNSAGIANAAGAGITLAEWVVDGKPSRDVWAVDIRRFGAFHRSPAFLRDRCAEVLGLHYAMPWPRKELESARNLRRTPLHAVHERNGSVFGQKFGWERVNYYGDDVSEHTIDAKPQWLESAKREHLHCRANASLFDVTSFAKLLVSGPDAEKCLQSLCCADVSPMMECVYTGMLNEEGGYESDCTVTRLDKETFLVVSPTAAATRDADWIRRGLRGGEAVVTDVSNQYAVLAVMGPRARDLLRACVIDPTVFDDEKFPFAAAREIDVGHFAVRAHRLTYVGELGYELYVPAESAVGVYEALHAASEATDGVELRDGGYYAIDALRTEKGYRAWGHELDPTITPRSAGLGFCVDWSKDFIGKDALLAEKDRPMTRRVVALRTENEDLPIWGHEPVLRDGVVVGNVMSGNYGHSVGGQVALCILNHADVGRKGFVAEGEYEIDVGGTMLEATGKLGPFYDPKGRKVKGLPLEA